MQQVKTINSIEVASVCDNQCQYCPAPLQRKYREVGLMSFDVFKRAIEFVAHFAHQGTQREVNLFGVGEPTLHPNLVNFIKYAREHVPLRIPLHLNTNGNRMTRDLAIQIKNAGVEEIDITAHNPHSTVKTIRIFESVGIRYRVSFDPVLRPNNWAGQVDWFEPEYPKPFPCPWLTHGQVMIMSNGDVTTCCLDAFAQGVVGNVMDSLKPEWSLKPFQLCRTCHHTL